LAATEIAFKVGKSGSKCDKSPQLIQEKTEIYRDNMTRAYIKVDSAKISVAGI